MLLTLPELIAKARANLRCLDAETGLKKLRATRRTLVDVREPEEREASPAPYTVNIPRGIVEMKIMEVVTSRTRIIRFICTVRQVAAPAWLPSNLKALATACDCDYLPYPDHTEAFQEIQSTSAIDGSLTGLSLRDNRVRVAFPARPVPPGF